MKKFGKSDVEIFDHQKYMDYKIKQNESLPAPGLVWPRNGPL